MTVYQQQLSILLHDFYEQNKRKTTTPIASNEKQIIVSNIFEKNDKSFHI